MKKYLSKKAQKRKKAYRILKAKPIYKPWELATRLEHRRIREKKKWK